MRQNWASVDQLGTVQVSAAFLGHTGTRWFTTFWGTFGWLNLPFEPAVYQEAVLLVGLAVGGLLGLGLAQLRRRSAGAPDADPSTGVGVLLAGLNILLTGLTALVYALTFGDAGTQGRYLFPALPACALLFSAGLCGPLGALRRLGTPTLAPYACGLLVGLVVAGGSWLNLHALDAVIRPAYLTPAEVRRQVVVPALPAGAVPVRPPAAFAPGMWLEGYAVAPRQPDRQAGPLTVTLYWRAGAATAENWLGFVHVTDGVHDLAQSEGPPGAGHYQVYKWRVGELVRDTRILALSDSQARQVQQATGPLRLYVGWIRAGDGARAFLADGADGVTLAWP